mmetsp:Transcript_24778/g.44877  ORF Transcript_24778/g.44877 Transcript_24778/m.44877 type:complete len:360 (-) Transcript_24778:71-1150(-)
MAIVSKQPKGRTSSPSKRFLYLFIVLCLAWASVQYSQCTTTTSINRLASPTDLASSAGLAMKQSFGFFDDISDKQWKLLQKIVAEHVNHKYPEQPLTHNPHFDKRNLKYFNSYPAWWQTNYEPNFSCQFERRIGGATGNGDGPKWICDPHRIAQIAAARKTKDPAHPGCVIYSIGSNGDFSFEWGMQQAVGAGVCEFHIFDMGDYAEKMPKDLERAHFHQWGLMKQSSDAGDDGSVQPGAQYYGLRDTIKLLGHENLDTIDIFKIDCEKCEWKTFQDWVGPGIPSLQQIQVEVHGAPPEAITFFDSFEEEGYVRFHKEPNIQFNDGSCVEFALLKLDKEFFELKNEMKKARDVTLTVSE